jgi:hypothetical protein
MEVALRLRVEAVPAWPGTCLDTGVVGGFAFGGR